MTIGEKIKKYRLKRNLSQKQLASLCEISEPAIRNYELGNRQPSEKQIDNIAYVLEVSPYAISNPELDTDNGIMHILFFLEEYCGLVAYKDDNCFYNLTFDINHKRGSSLNKMVAIWIEKKEQLEAGIITQEYYKEWCSSYPRLYAKECKEEFLRYQKLKKKK